MKKLTIIFSIILVSIVLVLPLYAQENDTDKERTSFDFTRKYFEIGINTGAGLDNSLMGSSEIFKKDIILDLNKLGSKDGLNINTDLLGDFFINVRMDHDWGFGLFAGVDGSVSGNLSQSLLTLISKGNANDPVSSGTIGASGSVFADVGLNGYAKFGDWRVGASAAVYIPVVYISKKSELTYLLDTSKGVKLSTEGSIDVYTPFSLQEDASINAEDFTGAYGLDFSLEAEYALFPFLDLGASISHIPLSAAELNNRTQFSLKSDSADGYIINSEDLLSDGLTIADIDLERTSDNKSIEVRRPIRFDVYGIYRPLSWNPDLLAVRGNMGITADITGEETYFNFGLQAQTSLFGNLFSAWLATGLVEDIWQHDLGIALNLRAFELALEGSLRSENFVESFSGHGFGVNVGLRFGW